MSEEYDIEFVDQPVLIVKRWRPLDHFSMIHDDLMPIYFTLKYLCMNDDINECLDNDIIAFEDETKSSLYEALLPNIMYLSKYSNYFGEHQLLCFKHATIGLESDSLWFNHGFDGSSGPIHNINFRPHLIETFRQFVIRKFKQNPNNEVEKFLFDAVIFDSDKFKNSQEIKALLQQQFKLKVNIVDPKNKSTEELINLVSTSRVLIAFTGSVNIFSLFLQRLNCGVLELFPFGLDETSLPHISTLVQKRGLLYRSWINTGTNTLYKIINQKNLTFKLQIQHCQTKGLMDQTFYRKWILKPLKLL